jgi:hypothetical protein
MAHTPGPWRLSLTDETLVLAGKQQEVASAHCINYDDDWEMVAANARLIAAAPDLLELLIAARAGLASASDNTDEWQSQCRPMLDAIDAAISRATGTGA